MKSFVSPFRQFIQRALIVLSFFGIAEMGWGQVTMTTNGSYNQNFNVLSSAAAATPAWTDNTTIANWYSQRTGTGGTTYIVDTGSGSTGGLYSYGSASATDRAIGTIGSGTAGSFAHGVLLKNTSSTTISDIKVSYTLEEWRKSGVTAAQNVTCYYKISSTSFSTLNPNANAGWTQVTGLTLSSPINTSTAAAIDGNATANKVSLSNISIPSLSLANNEFIMLKWEDPDHTGNDHGLSIDDVTISWTIAAPTPAITGSATASAFTTTYGTASAAQTFNVSGNNLTADLIATAPTGFEVSADGITYGITATFAQNSGSVSGTLRVRIKATAAVTGTSYNGVNIQLTSTGASNVNITTAASGNSVSAKALVVTASAQTKTAGELSPTTGTLNTHFTVSGLENSDVANQVALSYSGSPAGNLGTAAAGSYTITPSALTFSTGSSSNYSITYNTGTLTINTSTSPTLTAVVLGSALSSAYGTASNGVSFAVGGLNLTTTITATPQLGYEISSELNGVYQSTEITGITDGTTLYVRIASTKAAGFYNSVTAVVLSGGGATFEANVTTSPSGNSVSQKTLTIEGLTAQNKVYDGLSSAIVSGTANIVDGGVVNSDIVSLSGSGTFTFYSSVVGAGIAITTTGYSLIGTNASNYALTQPSFSADITPRSLTITASNVSKFAGVTLIGGAGSTAFTSSGLQNSETIGSVVIAYGTAGAAIGDGNTVGVYASQVTPSAATGGTFTASNYSISYVAGSITVTAVPVTLAAWDFNGYSNGGSSPQPPTISNSSLTIGGLTRGSALGASGTPAANAWGTTVSVISPTTASTAITANSFISFTVKSNSGATVSLAGVEAYNVRRSGSGPTNGQWQYSIDGTNFSNIGSVITWGSTTTSVGNSQSSIDLSSISELQNLTSSTTVIFRIALWGGTNATSSWYLNQFQTGYDFIINGYIKTTPQLSTTTSSSITATSVTLGATISSDGGASITARGTVLGTSAAPTGNSLAEGGTSVETFSHSRTGLTANTLYYYRGYATNSVGTGYSADGTFTTLPLAPIVGSGSSASTSAFTANWTAATMGSASFTYTVEVDDDNAFGTINSTVTSIASSNTSASISGLSAGTIYYYRVKSVNAEGSSSWSSASNAYATTPSITVTVGAYTYNGSAQGPTTVTGNSGAGTVTWSYVGTGSTSYTASATLPTLAGTYTATASIASNGNYSSATSSATAFTITPALLTVTLADQTKCEGSTLNLSTTSFTVGGIMSPDAITSISYTSASNVAVGTYNIVPSIIGTGLANYTVTNSGTLTVTPLSWIGGTSGNWNNDLHWCGNIPTSSSSVVIPTDAVVTLDITTTITNLSINSGGSLLVPSGKVLTVTGSITNNGTFDIQSGGQLVQGTGSTFTSSSTAVSKYTKAMTQIPNTATGMSAYNRAYYIGSPVVGTGGSSLTMAPIVGSSYQTMVSYTENTGTWLEHYINGVSQGSSSNNVFVPGKGYAVNSSPSTLNGPTYFSQAVFSGNAFNNGDISVTLTNGTGGGYNLISNPYPSGINWSEVYGNTNNTSLVESTYWLRTYVPNAGMVFQTCNGAGGVSIPSNMSTIAPATAFWVKRTGASGTFKFTNAMRTSGSATYYTMNANHIIRLDLGNGTYEDQAVVYMNEDAGLGIESYDSDKRIPSSTFHQLYSLEGTTKLAINGFNNAIAKDTVLLGMQIPTAGTYTINASQIDATIEEDIFLEDKITGAYQNLKITPSYTFTSTQGTFNNRFVLHFAPFVPALPGQTAATAIAMPTSNWPQCNNVTSEDQWHAFTATSEGISIEVNTASTDIVIELQDGTGNVVAQENAVNGIGNETLNFFGLTAGQIYKVGVRNNISSQPTGSYGICVKSLKRGGCDYGAGPYSLCQYYKATWAGSTGVSYTFTFTGTSGPAAGQTFTRTQNSDICVLSTVTPLLPYGSTYDVVISNTYTLTDGAGNTEQITVPSNNGCQVITIAEPQTALSNSSSCNNGARFRGAVVSSLPWICGANNWRWRFTEVNPLTMQEVGLPIELNRGSASNYLNLGTVAQLQNGKTYAVQTAPMFSYTGTNYNWGPTQYLCIVGAANVTQDATQDAMQDPSEDAAQEPAQGSSKDALEGASQENDVLVYTTTGQQIKVWTNIENAEITNATVRIYNSTGSLVYTQRMNSNEMIIDLNAAAGLYIVEVGEVKHKVIISPLAP